MQLQFLSVFMQISEDQKDFADDALTSLERIFTACCIGCMCLKSHIFHIFKTTCQV